MDIPARTVAVWTADCSATVDLGRCAGPHAGAARAPACLVGTLGAAHPPLVDLSESAVKARLYECCLSGGTAFDIYRWINLQDLAALWPRLNLPAGLRAEWSGALHAIGLLGKS